MRSNVAVTNSLLESYSKSGAMADALQLFDLMPERNVNSWNVLISGYNRNSLHILSWGVFCRMRSLGFEPNVTTYENILLACSALQDPIVTQLVYSLAIKTRFSFIGPVRSRFIGLFTKTCGLEDGLRAFRDVSSCRNVVCWNTIISGAVRQGENLIALDIFCEMCRKSIVLSDVTFCIVLTACGALGEIHAGKGVQGLLIKCGVEDVTVGTALVVLYVKCGKMDEAVRQLLCMPTRNVVSWTAVIAGFVKMGDSASALKVFQHMRKLGGEINECTLSSLISACGKPDTFEEATQIHSLILKTGFYFDASVGASLISMYSKVGLVDRSEMVFSEMENLRNLGAWSAMVTSLTHNRNSGRTIELFQRMLRESLRPDGFCTSSVLSIIDRLNNGKQIHCYTIKTGLHFNLAVGSSLLRMYSNSDCLDDSYKVFQEVPDRDSFCWTSMLASFTEHGFASQALQLFREMLLDKIIPNDASLGAILAACSALHSQQTGKEIHGYCVRFGLENETEVCNALLNMYSKCGDLESARKVFDLIPQKDEVTCATLASGYAQNGYIDEALLLFRGMVIANLPIDSFTLSSVLHVIARSNRPSVGAQIQARITKTGLGSDAFVGSSLVMMYSKCGSVEDCSKAYDRIEEHNLVGMTSIIISYAKHGKGTEALRLYEIMKKEGIRPDAVTFVGVLSACSCIGLVEEAYYHLHSMTEDYGIEPDCRHYACMVDLFGRIGRLKEAERLINNMPIEPNAAVWRTLLVYCKLHGDVELGKLATDKVLELEPSKAGLPNIYADGGQTEEVPKTGFQKKGTGVRKESGWSFVDDNCIELVPAAR